MYSMSFSSSCLDQAPLLVFCFSQQGFLIVGLFS
uniref:Uncharacterized protein n=1 Tax=Rhizophora mucronata TaxID=61149 RepID=A0A2P2N8L0_RHIMU